MQKVWNLHQFCVAIFPSTQLVFFLQCQHANMNKKEFEPLCFIQHVPVTLIQLLSYNYIPVTLIQLLSCIMLICLTYAILFHIFWWRAASTKSITCHACIFINSYSWIYMYVLIQIHTCQKIHFFCHMYLKHLVSLQKLINDRSPLGSITVNIVQLKRISL